MRRASARILSLLAMATMLSDPHPAPVRLQRFSDHDLIVAVQAEMKREGHKLDRLEFDVFNNVQITRSERTHLGRLRLDPSVIAESEVFAQVAAYKPPASELIRFYSVRSTPSGKLRAEPVVDVHEITLEDLRVLREAADKAGQELVRTKDVSSLFDTFFAPNLFDDAKQLSLSLSDAVVREHAQGTELLRGLSKEERKRLLAGYYNCFLRSMEFAPTRKILGATTPGSEIPQTDYDEFFAHSGVAKGETGFSRGMLRQPVNTREELVQRLRALEKANRGLSEYLRANKAYDSVFYNFNMRRLTKSIRVAYKAEPGWAGSSEPAYVTNVLGLLVILRYVDSQLKIVGMAPLIP